MKGSILLFFPLFLISCFSIAQVRPYDKNGLNVFETPKVDIAKSDGLKLKVGGSFTQSFQTLQHSNNADPKLVGGVDANLLVPIIPGFNTANANLNLDVRLDEGVNLNMTIYLSARHHNEAWVKGGYIQFDKLPFMHNELLDNLMKYATIKVGHMEINYGDAHFRRSDNGNSLYNPFVENYILDGYATEIGAELDLQHKGFLGVASITNGEIKGDIGKVLPVDGATTGVHNPAFIGKLGYDKQLNESIRLRVTGSGYYTAGSISNTLYGGDRSGSHYFGVMENSISTTAAFSGRFNPGFSDKVGSLMGNIFLKVKGLEWFTTIETSSGRNRTEATERKASQLATDLVYRFGKSENFWIGARYNTATSEILDASDVKLDRFALAGGWFVTKNIMAKAEYVNQDYTDFAKTDIRSGGNFHGVVFEAVVGF